jgi:hypothetical protein
MASSTAYLIRASQGRGPWLTLNAWSAPAYRRALQALGVKGASKMTKLAMRNELLKFPKADVCAALGVNPEQQAKWREEVRAAECRKLGLTPETE